MNYLLFFRFDFLTLFRLDYFWLKQSQRGARPYDFALSLTFKGLIRVQGKILKKFKKYIGKFSNVIIFNFDQYQHVTHVITYIFKGFLNMYVNFSLVVKSIKSYAVFLIALKHRPPSDCPPPYPIHKKEDFTKICSKL